MMVPIRRGATPRTLRSFTRASQSAGGLPRTDTAQFATAKAPKAWQLMGGLPQLAHTWIKGSFVRCLDNVKNFQLKTSGWNHRGPAVTKQGEGEYWNWKQTWLKFKTERIPENRSLLMACSYIRFCVMPGRQAGFDGKCVRATTCFRQQSGRIQTFWPCNASNCIPIPICSPNLRWPRSPLGAWRVPLFRLCSASFAHREAAAKIIGLSFGSHEPTWANHLRNFLTTPLSGSHSGLQYSSIAVWVDFTHSR